MAMHNISFAAMQKEVEAFHSAWEQQNARMDQDHAAAVKRMAAEAAAAAAEHDAWFAAKSAEHEARMAALRSGSTGSAVEGPENPEAARLHLIAVQEHLRMQEEGLRAHMEAVALHQQMFGM